MAKKRIGRYESEQRQERARIFSERELQSKSRCLNKEHQNIRTCQVGQNGKGAETDVRGTVKSCRGSIGKESAGWKRTPGVAGYRAVETKPASLDPKRTSADDERSADQTESDRCDLSHPRAVADFANFDGIGKPTKLHERVFRELARRRVSRENRGRTSCRLENHGFQRYAKCSDVNHFARALGSPSDLCK